MPKKTEDIVALMPSSRRNGPGKWMCRCPAHDDRSASLSIMAADGMTLIHCFAGCSPDDIMGAIGLTLDDLWESPTPTTHYDPPKLGAIPHKSVADMFPILLTEAEIVAQATRELLAGHAMSIRDQARVILARYVIQDVANAYRWRT